jgi:hypothetical protein
MSGTQFKNAYFIKLGRGGKWESLSIEENKARIGWRNQALGDLWRKDWGKIRDELRTEVKSKGKATQDFNMLKTFVESTPADVWITFYQTRLWWCHLADSRVEEDDVSKYRYVSGKWSDQDINGHTLVVEDIPPVLAQIQAYRSTICKVKEVDALGRVLNDQPSRTFQEISRARDGLITQVQLGLQGLHPTEFEALVESLFSRAGWHRISREVAGTTKYYDFEFEEPITSERYQVQVKSAADAADFAKYVSQFSSRGYTRLYFVVHSPATNLMKYEPGTWQKKADLVLPTRLAQMVVDLGLTNWLMKKTK